MATLADANGTAPCVARPPPRAGKEEEDGKPPLYPSPSSSSLQSAGSGGGGGVGGEGGSPSPRERRRRAVTVVSTAPGRVSVSAPPSPPRPPPRTLLRASWPVDGADDDNSAEGADGDSYVDADVDVKPSRRRRAVKKFVKKPAAYITRKIVEQASAVVGSLAVETPIQLRGLPEGGVVWDTGVEVGSGGGSGSGSGGVSDSGSGGSGSGWMTRSNAPALTGLSFDETGSARHSRAHGSLDLDAIRHSGPGLLRGTLTSSVVAWRLHDSASFYRLVTGHRWMDWASSFRRTDPRYQILRFFNELAREGAAKIEERGLRPELASPLLRAFRRASVFTVWRPTSDDAIRKMMLGEGTGKGLDIKGKSAKEGMLSGYVPFLQLHEEEHKNKIRTLPRDGRMRIYYGTRRKRDKAARALEAVSTEMALEVERSKALLAGAGADADARERAMQTIVRWDVDDPSITYLEGGAGSGCFGIEVAERLFWEGCVVRRDCSRAPPYHTGRPSEPAFQDMNFQAIRKYHQKAKTNGGAQGPRPVVFQFASEDHVMCPRAMVMAYEEEGRVVPVVSDFDCFIVGTRNVKYKNQIPPEQLKVLKWCMSKIRMILDNPIPGKSWTQRWLEVLKQCAKELTSPKVPKFGYGDSKSNSIMEHAINRLNMTGAVRHGAECFNYCFPQELDKEFLVISDTLGPPGSVPWKKVGVQELQDILCRKIDEGFTFPLNPKWVLCDPGWKRVYDKLLVSQCPNVQTSMDCWFPPDSGLREEIEEIHSQHPYGFGRAEAGDTVATEGTEAMDLAVLNLKHYVALQRAKKKLRCLGVWMKLHKDSQERVEKALRESFLRREIPQAIPSLCSEDGEESIEFEFVERDKSYRFCVSFHSDDGEEVEIDNIANL